MRLMARTNRLLLLGALMAAIAAPVVAQSYSEGFTFLKAVRERDGATAERILSNPSSTAVNIRDPGTGESALHILVRGRDASWLNYMLARGARPDSASNDGTTPLILAAQIGWIEGAAVAARPRRQPQSRQFARRDAARSSRCSAATCRWCACCCRGAPIPTRPTMSRAIRRSIMRARTIARPRSCACSSRRGRPSAPRPSSGPPRN